MLTRFLESLMGRWLLLAHLYCFFYRRVVGREIAMAQISGSDRVLCIGSGPIPATAILIALRTGASIHAVDCDSHAIDRSRRLLVRMGLTSRINLTHCDGKHIDPSGFSVVHIARQIAPRHKVVNNITQGADSGARIVLRVPPKALAYLYDTERCWHISCRLANHNCLQRDDSLLLTRRNGNEKMAVISGRSAVGNGAPLVG